MYQYKSCFEDIKNMNYPNYIQDIHFYRDWKENMFGVLLIQGRRLLI